MSFSPLESFGRSTIFEPHLFSVIREFLGIKRIIPGRKEIISIEKIPSHFDLDDSFVDGNKTYLFWGSYKHNLISTDIDGIRSLFYFDGKYFRDKNSLHVMTTTEYCGYKKFNLNGFPHKHSLLYGKVRAVYKDEGYNDEKIEKIFGIHRSGFNHMTVCDTGLIILTKHVCTFGDSSITIIGWNRKVIARCFFDTAVKVGSDGTIFTFERQTSDASSIEAFGIKTTYKLSAFK